MSSFDSDSVGGARVDACGGDGAAGTEVERAGSGGTVIVVEVVRIVDVGVVGVREGRDACGVGVAGGVVEAGVGTEGLGLGGSLKELL